MAAVVEVIGLLERTPLTKEALEVVLLILLKVFFDIVLLIFCQ